MIADRLFFLEEIAPLHSVIALPEEAAKHIIQVLRMKKGDEIFFTDGKGKYAQTLLVDDHKKHPQIKVVALNEMSAPVSNFTIAIALTKNASRFEWFLEKATEIGISQIIPLKTHRTEKQHFRYDRMNNILISAMLQSQQFWLPKLWEPIALNDLWNESYVQNEPHKYIAHCIETDKKSLVSQLKPDQSTGMILIGPEGDFTEEEITNAIQNNFTPVSLGESRLRTETAGMVAASLLLNAR